jgi:uncharacterized protein (TIGR02453 family)
MASRAYFGPELFDFLRELRDHNDRQWFAANKPRYEAHVRDPLLEFIADFGPRLREISGQFVADPRPVGGSLFRIHRDTRFSKDKSPYKTNAGAHFRHAAGRDVHAPGFYLHLEPGQVFAASGLWHPDPTTLGRVRDAIVAHPARWERVVSEPTFASTCSLSGDRLARPPRGYDPDHRWIEDLKRREFVAVTTLSEADARGPDFMDRFADACRVSAPLARFLTEAAGLPW